MTGWRSRWLAAAIVVSAFLPGCSSTPEDSLEARKNYQAYLDAQPGRFNADFSISVSDGHMFVAQPMKQLSCARRCAAFEEKPSGGYKVYLPIGFQAPKNTPATSAVIGNISELAYWDPVRHMQMALPGTNDEPVPLPEVLVRWLTDDLKMDEIAYIDGSYVHPRTSGGWGVDSAPIWHESIGLEYSLTITVRIKRVANGLEVCAPPDQPLSATVSDSGQLVSTLTRSC